MPKQGQVNCRFVEMLSIFYRDVSFDLDIVTTSIDRTDGTKHRKPLTI